MTGPSLRSRRDDPRSLREHRSSIVNQVFQLVGRAFKVASSTALSSPEADLVLGPENAVNFFLDIRQFGLGTALANSTPQRIERIQRAFTFRIPKAGETSRRRQAWWPRLPVSWVSDPVAGSIHEALPGAVVEGRRSGMQRQVGIRVGAGRCDLREIGCSAKSSRRTCMIVCVSVAIRSEPSFLFATR